MGLICLVACLALLAILAFCLSVAEIVMGSIFLQDCAAERYIPIYLVVSGCVGVVLAVSSGTDAHKTHEKSVSGNGSGSGGGEGDGEKSRLQGGTDELENQSPGERCWSALRGLLSLFAFIWMIIGMYWVLHVYGNISSNSRSPMFCHPQLYMFALAMVFIRLALIIATVVLAICVCCGLVCCAAFMG